jgi:hypothetical protein
MFCSRHAWGKQVVAHSTQFAGREKRARIGKERIRSRLGSQQADWLLPPPKPKWMRWTTFEREMERYSRYEQVGLERTISCAAKLAKLLQNAVDPPIRKKIVI